VRVGRVLVTHGYSARLEETGTHKQRDVALGRVGKRHIVLEYRKISFLAALARYRPPTYTGRGQLELETTVRTPDNGPLAVAADVSGIGESWRAQRCKN
jgi:hypothetical protein